MENRHVTIDELKLANSLCPATIHAIMHDDLKMKVCEHWVHGTSCPNKRGGGCRIAKSCSLFTIRIQRDNVPLFTGDESWFLSSSGDEKAIYAVDT
jgi:hypothetical protein